MPNMTENFDICQIPIVAAVLFSRTMVDCSQLPSSSTTIFFCIFSFYTFLLYFFDTALSGVMPVDCASTVSLNESLSLVVMRTTPITKIVTVTHAMTIPRSPASHSRGRTRGTVITNAAFSGKVLRVRKNSVHRCKSRFVPN